MIWCWKGDLDNNKLVLLYIYIMEQLGRRQKIIPITWKCTMFRLSSFTVALVGINIEKRDMQFVTAKFAPLYL